MAPLINKRGETLVWLAPNVVNRLKAMRGSGDSYSDVIVQIAGAGDMTNERR